jgi:hypothetical protein
MNTKQKLLAAIQGLIAQAERLQLMRARFEASRDGELLEQLREDLLDDIVREAASA